MTLRDIDRTQKAPALDILCAAFRDYPVPRYVIEPTASDYDGKLRELIDFFVEGRLTRSVPLIGLYDSNDLLGVAVLSPPQEGPLPPQLEACRARTERQLGREAMGRFERYEKACEATDPGHIAHYLG